MDITGVSTALSNVSAMPAIGTAVLKKAMDTNESIGNGMVELLDAAAMERSVNPDVGGNIDMRI